MTQGAFAPGRVLKMRGFGYFLDNSAIFVEISRLPPAAPPGKNSARPKKDG
jgi:hypothetical protein